MIKFIFRVEGFIVVSSNANIRKITDRERLYSLPATLTSGDLFALLTNRIRIAGDIKAKMGDRDIRKSNNDSHKTI